MAGNQTEPLTETVRDAANRAEARVRFLRSVPHLNGNAEDVLVTIERISDPRN